jgi:REG-2-like HAD superfamily hydrolase
VRNVLSDASQNKIQPNEFTKVADKLIDLYKSSECWNKFNKSNELLSAIKNEKKVLGVISNFDPRLHELFTNMKLSQQFDFILTSYEANVEKPNEEIFKLALEKANKFSVLNIQPNEALHIGNEIDKDYDAAKKAGWSASLINSENESSYKNIEHFWSVINSQEMRF